MIEDKEKRFATMFLSKGDQIQFNRWTDYKKFYLVTGKKNMGRNWWVGRRVEESLKVSF